jgi:hypothetical protein
MTIVRENNPNDKQADEDVRKIFYNRESSCSRP